MGWANFEVQCGFGGGEETTRFGPRQEIGSSLYQVDTVACVNNQTDGYGIPWLLSTCCTQRMALILERSVIVFDETCSEHQCTFSSGFLIDAVAWSDDGSFLVYGDRSGMLSIAHLDSQQVLFSKKIVPNQDARKSACFVSVMFVNVDDFFELFVITGTGIGFRFKNLDLISLKKAVAEQDIDLATKIQGQIELVNFEMTEYHTVVGSVTYDTSGEDKSLLIGGIGDFGMTEWYIDNKDIISTNISQHMTPELGFKKCLETPDKNFIVALDTENHISLWYRDSFIFCDMWAECTVDDFILFVTSSVDTDKSKSSKSREEIKIVVLTQAVDKKRELKVLSLPDFQHVYTLTVSCCAVLATSPLQQETIMLIEGVEEEDLDDSIDDFMKKDFNVSTVRVRCLMEAIPQNRFSRLLHKKKFLEAEQFAKMFGLDVQLVHKVKSNYILDQLSPWGQDQYSKSTVYEDILKELKLCLDKIEDMEHVVNCCLQAQLPTLNATYDLLNYAREKINFGARTFTESSDLFQAICKYSWKLLWENRFYLASRQLLDGINRLVTFEVAFGAGMFNGATWSHFLSSALCDEVISCFKDRNINAGIIIWRRHQSEFQSKFTISKLEEILHSIHPRTPSSKIIPWLREDFVPYVLTVLPEGQCILADWLEKAAKSLELSENEKWPDNALDLAEVMYTAFSNVSQSTQERGVATPVQFATKICKLSIPYFDNAGAEENGDDNNSPITLSTAMKKLGNLVKNLREVKSLHHEYNCKLSLHQYESEDTKSIAFRLLNRIAAAELIPETIKKFVKPYVLKNNLKLDHVLYEYIVELVDLQNQVASLWEPKVIAIINEIEKKEQRCDATLHLMLKACTPWSKDVEALVSAQMIACPENEKLKRQYQFAMLRKLMARYSIRDINLADMSRIEDIIKYMFSKGNPEALAHALEISKHLHGVTTADVYLIRIKSWITAEKTWLIGDFLRKIPVNDAIKVSYHALNWFNTATEWPPLDDEDRHDQMQLTNAVVLILNTVSKLDKKFKSNISHVARNLKNISCLQSEFGMFVSFREYNEKEFRKQLVKKYIKTPADFASKVGNNFEKKKKKSNHSSRLYRFAELLNIENGYLDELLIDMYLDRNEFDEIYKIGSSLLRIDGDERFIHSLNHRVHILHKIVYLLMSSSVNNSPFNWVKCAEDLHTFAAQALSLCIEDKLNDYLHLSKLMRLAAVIASQCESTDYQDDSKRMDGVIHQWIEDQYKDDSLVISSAEALGHLQKIVSLNTNVSVNEDDVMRYDSMRLSGKGPSCAVVQTEDSEPVTKLDIVEFSKQSEALINLLQQNNQQEIALQILLFVMSVCGQHSAALQIGIPIDLDEDTDYHFESQLIERELKASEVILSHVENVLNQSTMNLVKSILSHRIVDHDLALCYLDIFPTTNGHNILLELQNKFNNKFTRIQTLAKVGVDFAALRNNNKLREYFQALKECAYWGRKLQQLRVQLQQHNVYAMHADTAERKRVLDSLVQHQDIDLQSIINFCEAFSYDEEQALLKYVECQLHPTSEKILASDDVTYQEKVDECIQLYANKLQNCVKLERLLNGIILKVSPYDYERLIYVFKKCAEITENEDIKMVAEENVTLLEMLTLYECTASTSEYSFHANIADDIDDDQILSNKSSILPDFAKKRLPFHSLTQKSYQWQILNPEFTSEQNVIKLKPIVNKLKLDPDHMFAKAVQKIAEKNFKNKTKNGGSTFEYGMVENILNMIEKHMIMIATTKWLAKSLPRGAEKAKVLKALVDRAAIVVQENIGREEAEKSFKRFLDVYKRVSIENALLEHGISDEKFFLLCNQPVKLIIELYEEFGDKVRFETGKLSGAPEIHSLAEKIATISEDVDLQRVHTYLMNKWLPCVRVSDQEDEEETGNMLILASVSKKDLIKKENERNLRRVIYVLASSYNQTTMQSLLRSVYSEGDTASLSNVCRIRALQVLFTLVDAATIERLSNFSTADINEKLVACIYLSELESLHISQSEEAFIKSSKEALVKGLWRNHSHEPQGIRLIADLCLDHKIFDPQLWNSLLIKLLSFDMIEYLTHVLVLLSGIPQLREIPSLTKMWRSVVISPFQSVSTPLSNEEEKRCSEAAQLLTRCPVILDIGLPEISILMKKAGLFIQSLTCMKLIPDRKSRKKNIQALLEDVGIDVILSRVKIKRERYGMDAHLDAIEEEVFNYVNENNLFVSLYGTVHFDRLVGYLVRTKNMNNLLMKTIDAGKINNATDLVSMYASVHSDTPVAKTIISNNMDPHEALLYFLQEGNLLSGSKLDITSLLKVTDVSNVAGDLNFSATETTNNNLHLNGFMNAY